MQVVKVDAAAMSTASTTGSATAAATITAAATGKKHRDKKHRGEKHGSGSDSSSSSSSSSSSESDSGSDSGRKGKGKGKKKKTKKIDTAPGSTSVTTPLSLTDDAALATLGATARDQMPPSLKTRKMTIYLSCSNIKLFNSFCEIMMQV